MATSRRDQRTHVRLARPDEEAGLPRHHGPAGPDDQRDAGPPDRPDRPDRPDFAAARRPAGQGPGASQGHDQAGVSDQPGRARRDRPRLPSVRLAPRDELAVAARVAPLMRAAMELRQWAADRPAAASPGQGPAQPALSREDTTAAAAALDLAPHEVDAAWRVAVATGLAGGAAADDRGPLNSWDAEQVLTAWDRALAAILDADDLDGLATALYTVGAPVRMDGLFDAYAAAAGPGRAGSGSEIAAGEREEAAALSFALETLADLGVVELGTDESAGGLTVSLSPLGIWGVHRRLRAQGWHVPVLGGADQAGAAGLLATLASCDAEDGEAEITAWLNARSPEQAAAELIDAAADGSPGLRGAAFAVLDRIGDTAAARVRAALAEPLLRAHAAVWLHEHGQQAELSPDDRTWLLVDLGAGLLEEADPRDVVAELLPELPAAAQAEIVAVLWQVQHPGVIGLLTTLSDHHPDPGVARAARKAAFKARSAGQRD